MSMVNVSELIELAETKKKLFKKMFLLSEKQKKAITNEEFEKLEGILDNKDEIIDQVNEIDLKFVKINDEEKIEDKDLLSLLSDIKNILNDIKALDSENNENLSKTMSDMTHEIKDMRQGVRAMQNYGNADPYQSFASQGGTLFIDQDS